MRLRICTVLVLAIAASADAAVPTSQPATQPAAALAAEPVRVLHVTPVTWPALRDSVRAGDVVEFDDGYYGRLAINVANTTWRSEHRYGARFSAPDTQTHGWEGIAVYADHVTLDGLSACGSMYYGVRFDPTAHHLTVRNCWIASNRVQGLGGTADDVLIERCLIEHNGQHPQLDHGVYAAGWRHAYRDNIVRYNACQGFSMGPMVRAMVFERNLVYRNGGAGILFFVSVGGDREHTRVIDNTVADNKSQVAICCYDRDREQPSALVAGNVLIGPDPVVFRESIYAPITANATVRDNVQALAGGWFVNAAIGDYRAKMETPAWGHGWPRENWWTDTGDWPNGWPVCRDPALGPPRSLFPD